MDKQEIANQLKKGHEAFITKIDGLSEKDFIQKPGNKWTAGQQLEHIIKSVKPVDMAFGLPTFVLKMKFGLANRSSKSYDGLVTKYLNVLKANKDYVLPDRFAPEVLSYTSKTKKLQKLSKLVGKLSTRLSRFTEDDLDNYILPHPVMGQLTLREMLYFTIYHVQHHNKQILENLNKHKNVQ